MGWPIKLDRLLLGKLPIGSLLHVRLPRRGLVLSGLILSLVAGCQTPQQPFDPFMAGRTTIPPPGTAVPSGAAPYYSGGPPTVVMPGQPNVVPSPGFSTPGAAIAAPPANLPVPPPTSGLLPRGVSLPQSSLPTPGSTTPVSDAGNRLAQDFPENRLYFDPRQTGNANPQANNVLPVSNRVTEPFAATLRNDRAIARPLDRSAGLPEIGDLPVARSSTLNATPVTPELAKSATPAGSNVTPATASLTSNNNNSVRLAGGDWQATGTKQANNNPPTNTVTTLQPAAGTSALTSAKHDAYSHDPQYRRLKGKLEYAQSTGRWKLRYIPVDGETDDYGGSVELPDANRMSGLQPGDLVTVEGRVSGTSAVSKSGGSGGFAPAYAIDRIAKQ